jgi:glycosyltransferase involved in cell wall biosynthesis
MRRVKDRKRKLETGWDPEPIRVLHVSTPLSWRGGEQQLSYLVQGLEEKGLQQSVLGPSGSALEAHCESKGRAFVPFRRKGFLNFLLAWKLSDLARSYSPDLIHVHDAHAHTAAFLAAQLFRVPIPIVVHRRVDFPVGSNFFSRWKFDHPRVKQVIAVSEAIERIGRKGVKRGEKWTSIRSGIDPERIRSRKDPLRLRKELDLPDGIPIIGNVAALADHKDHPTFLRTARAFFDNGGEGRFVLIGDGPERGRIEEMIEELGLQDRVFLLGFRTDVPELMSGFDLFLMSSKTEGLGTSLLDAMAASVPIVSTNAGGIPELVRHRENGILCDVGDHSALAGSLNELLMDDELRRRLVRKGNEVADEHHFSRMAGKVYTVYRKVLERA